MRRPFKHMIYEGPGGLMLFIFFRTFWYEQSSETFKIRLNKNEILKGVPEKFLFFPPYLENHIKWKWQSYFFFKKRNKDINCDNYLENAKTRKWFVIEHEK